MSKMVLITGASGNLGTVVTQHFLDQGYKVIGTVSNEASKKEMPAHAALDLRVANLANEEETHEMIGELVKRYGKIDAALLLAGGFAMGNIAGSKQEAIRHQFSINFDTAYNVVQPLYQHMIENNYGRIVLIGSRPALKATDGKNMIAYGLSKSLLFKLAEYLNADAKGKNVTTTVVVPSTIDTPPNRQSMPKSDPSNWVKPQSLAEIFEFIISEKAATLRETVLKVYNNA
jgi:NAD(P)-dependent dehydrogenase (short-subunit alcohol dehydrogenase family)